MSLISWIKKRANNPPAKNLTVYLHFPCFDGVSSAAVMAEALRVKENLALGRVVPVNYDIRDRWLGTKLEPYSAVVDFLFHPSASYWADHHATPFVNDENSKDYWAGRKEGRYLYEATADCCAKVVWQAFGSLLQHQQQFGEIVHWASKIDSANYTSVEEAILGDHPALRINKSLIISPDPIYCDLLVRSFMNRGIGPTSRHPEVCKRVDNAERRLQRGLRNARRAVRLIDDVAVMELFQDSKALVSRYAPYYFYPNAKYSIVYTHSQHGIKLTAMRNPWLEFDSVPIGSILSRYGGGGHSRVGALIIPKDQTTRLTLVIEDLLREFRRSDLCPPDFEHQESVHA